MTAPILDASPGSPDRTRAIAKAVASLRAGRLVAMPTETVYGLCAALLAPDAVDRLRAAKGRAESTPFTIQVSSLEAARDWAHIPAWAESALTVLWPGPLTAVLPARRPQTLALGSESTVGIRVPDHPVALALLAAMGEPVVATSANRSGEAALNDAQAIAEEFREEVDLVLSDQAAASGRASTVVSLTARPPRVLRAGEITEARILELCRITG